MLRGGAGSREGALCLQAVFGLLDTLQKWCEDAKATALSALIASERCCCLHACCGWSLACLFCRRHRHRCCCPAPPPHTTPPHSHTTLNPPHPAQARTPLTPASPPSPWTPRGAECRRSSTPPHANCWQRCARVGRRVGGWWWWVGMLLRASCCCCCLGGGCCCCSRPPRRAPTCICIHAHRLTLITHAPSPPSQPLPPSHAQAASRCGTHARALQY